MDLNLFSNSSKDYFQESSRTLEEYRQLTSPKQRIKNERNNEIK